MPCYTRRTSDFLALMRNTGPFSGGPQVVIDDMAQSTVHTAPSNNRGSVVFTTLVNGTGSAIVVTLDFDGETQDVSVPANGLLSLEFFLSAGTVFKAQGASAGVLAVGRVQEI